MDCTKREQERESVREREKRGGEGRPFVENKGGWTKEEGCGEGVGKNEGKEEEEREGDVIPAQQLQ